uniref:VWFA domain-containing protein n=1 Tax=Arcella intermedia TaxID=1963864 RepID=A0A6B2KXH9_9EUKA
MSNSRGVDIVLEIMDIQLDVNTFGVTATYTMVFSNRSNDNVEVTYQFPLPPSARVSLFEAVVDSKFYKGRLDLIEDAENAYSDHVASGGTAYMGNQINASFKVNIGNFPPHSLATIKFSWIMEHQILNRKISFSLPSLLVLPIHGVHYSHITFNFAVPIESLEVKDVQYEKWIDNNTAKVSIGASEYLNPNSISFGVLLGKDLPSTNTEIWDGPITDENYRYVTHIKLPILDLPPLECEYIFLLDVSGSMDGIPFTQSLRSLKYFLSSLPTNSYFNVYAFESSFSILFQQPEPYNGENLKKARQWVNNIVIGGGTNILSPLADVFQQAAQRKRNIFLITDGQVEDSATVIELVKENAGTCQCFTIGLGSGVDENLVRELATVGNGTCEIIKDSQHIHSRVLTQLRTSNTPPMKNIQITASGQILKSSLDLPDNKMSSLFLDRANNLYVYCKELPTNLTIDMKGEINGETQNYSFPINNTFIMKHHILHQLGAVSWINNTANPTVEMILELSRTFGVCTNYTSFTVIQDDAQRAYHPVLGSMKFVDELLGSKLDKVDETKMAERDRMWAEKKDKEKENLMKQKQDIKDYFELTSKKLPSLIEEQKSLLSNEILKSLNEPIEELTQKAIKASQNGPRRDGFIHFLALVQKGISFDLKLRNEFSVSMKNIIGDLRSQHLSLKQSFEQLSTLNQNTVRDYVNAQAYLIANALTILDNVQTIVPKDEEDKVFFVKLRADYYRYLCEVDKEKWKDESMRLYEEALLLAKNLYVTHPVRLGLALNASVFYSEIMGQQDKANMIAKTTFDDSIAELDNLDEDSYKDSTVILQLVRDNLTLWSTDGDKNQGEVPTQGTSVVDSETLEAILFSQNADGSWDDITSVAGFCGLTEALISNSASQNELIYLLTALIIIKLNLDYKAKEDDWTIIIQKAHKFLTKFEKTSFLQVAATLLK